MDNDYGVYGVLRFLKKDDDRVVVANYPIDDDELTFGKEAECNIRLYYPTVSQQHAKIVFHDRKVTYRTLRSGVC
jgi:pSer/pThr/pTyr-binding forkhead associated (FHA) protein